MGWGGVFIGGNGRGQKVRMSQGHGGAHALRWGPFGGHVPARGPLSIFAQSSVFQ